MYRTICTQLWTDPKVKQLPPFGKLLFLYAITNPYTHLSGCYYLPQEVIKKEAGITDTLCHTLYHTLSKLDLLHRDLETETIFVTHMFKYQGRGPKNEKAAATHLLTLHSSSLIHRFFAVYPAVCSYWTGYPIDTLSDLEKRCPPVPVPILLSSSSPDLKSNGHAKRGPTQFPEDWKLTAEEAAGWVQFGIEPSIEFATFRDHARTTDRRCHDWKAAWRNWARKALKIKEEKRYVQPMR